MDLFIDLKPEPATGTILLNFLIFNKQLLHSFIINKAYIEGSYTLNTQEIVCHPTMDNDTTSLSTSELGQRESLESFSKITHDRTLHSKHLCALFLTFPFCQSPQKP